MANSDLFTHERRKADHIRINLEEQVQFRGVTTGLEKVYFMHRAIPELNLTHIDIASTLFGKKLAAPLLISSMTGGTTKAGMLNVILAEAAQEAGIAMGLGSQRAAIEDPILAASYRVRDVAPDILLFANVGAVQLNYGYGVDACQRAVDMVSADALILHLNVLQEAVQPEGDDDFSELLPKIEEICRRLPVPVIAKEVGWGISAEDARLLQDVGIAAIDVAGAGGTSWSEVEMYRAPTPHHARVAGAFIDWGIPTADSLRYCHDAVPNLPMIASGGLKTGIDVAKCMALGASLSGFAGEFLKAADQNGTQGVLDLVAALNEELMIAMLCAGAADLTQLKNTPLYER